MYIAHAYLQMPTFQILTFRHVCAQHSVIICSQKKRLMAYITSEALCPDHTKLSVLFRTCYLRLQHAEANANPNFLDTSTYTYPYEDNPMILKCLHNPGMVLDRRMIPLKPLEENMGV